MHTTIVTEIVNDMFRSKRSKKAFAEKLAKEPVDSESETEPSDAESLDTRDRVAVELTEKADRREEYFMWGAELSRSRDVYKLELDDHVNEEEERHLLLLKQVCLGVNAIQGERNVIEIHITDFSDKERRYAIASLTLGVNDFANLDLRLSWSKNKDIKLKLVMGSGPIVVTGNHFVERVTPSLDKEEDPDYVAETTDDETEISTFEDPEHVVDDKELEELAKEREEAEKQTLATSDGEGKRKRGAASPSAPSTKKRKSDSDDDVNGEVKA